MTASALRLARKVDPRYLAAGLALIIALLAYLGSGGSGTPADIWNPGGEYNVPNGFTALLLVGAGALALAAPGSVATSVLGVCLVIMGIDEAVAGHDHLGPWLGISDDLVLLPLALVAGAAWLLTVMHLPSRAARVMLIGAALAWVCAYVLDAINPGNDPEIAGSEELLEPLGAAAFLLCFLLAVRAGGSTGHRESAHDESDQEAAAYVT